MVTSKIIGSVKNFEYREGFFCEISAFARAYRYPSHAPFRRPFAVRHFAKICVALVIYAVCNIITVVVKVLNIKTVVEQCGHVLWV